MFLLTRAVTTGWGSRGATDDGGSGGGVTATGDDDGAGGSADGVVGTDDALSVSIVKQEYLERDCTSTGEYSRGSVLTNGMDARDWRLACRAPAFTRLSPPYLVSPHWTLSPLHYNALDQSANGWGRGVMTL